MPTYNNRYRSNRRATGFRSSRGRHQPFPPRRGLPLRRRIPLSGMTRPRGAFGYPVGHRRLPLPYLITKTMGPTALEAGEDDKKGGKILLESHIVTKLDVDTGDSLSGVLLTVSLPSVAEGSIYVAEVLSTTRALTAGTTAQIHQSLPYHAGSSTRIPTRLVRAGSLFSKKRLTIRRATTRTLYFRLNVTPDVGDSGRAEPTRVYLVEHLYGYMSGERHMVSYIRTNVSTVRFTKTS